MRERDRGGARQEEERGTGWRGSVQSMRERERGREEVQGRRRREDRMEGFSPEYEREGERRCRTGGGERTGWRGSVQSMRERERGGAGQEEERGQDGGVQSRV